LPDLCGYLRLGRGYPVGQFKLAYKKYKKVAEDFILKPNAGAITEHGEKKSLPRPNQENKSIFGKRGDIYDIEEESDLSGLNGKKEDRQSSEQQERKNDLFSSI
jgi:hypothetical protein